MFTVATSGLWVLPLFLNFQILHKQDASAYNKETKDLRVPTEGISAPLRLHPESGCAGQAEAVPLLPQVPHFKLHS